VCGAGHEYKGEVNQCVGQGMSTKGRSISVWGRAWEQLQIMVQCMQCMQIMVQCMQCVGQGMGAIAGYGGSMRLRYCSSLSGSVPAPCGAVVQAQSQPLYSDNKLRERT